MRRKRARQAGVMRAELAGPYGCRYAGRPHSPRSSCCRPCCRATRWSRACRPRRPPGAPSRSPAPSPRAARSACCRPKRAELGQVGGWTDVGLVLHSVERPDLDAVGGVGRAGVEGAIHRDGRRQLRPRPHPRLGRRRRRRRPQRRRRRRLLLRRRRRWPVGARSTVETAGLDERLRGVLQGVPSPHPDAAMGALARRNARVNDVREASRRAIRAVIRLLPTNRDLGNLFENVRLKSLNGFFYQLHTLILKYQEGG